MAYSKAFREGLEDAVAKTRWRMETHLQSHLLPHPEESPATRGDLSKSLVVLHDSLENFVSEVVNYLEQELARQKAGGGPAPTAAAAKAPPRPKAKARPASGRKPSAAKRRRR